MAEDAARAELDAELMRRALELGLGGDPSPNPHVGAVVAEGADMIGEGFHNLAGDDHGEIVALHPLCTAERSSCLRRDGVSFFDIRNMTSH